MTKKNNEIVIQLTIAEELQTMSDKFEKVVIAKLPIRLGQFLKLANVVQDGFEATRTIQNGEVQVNGNDKTWCIATAS
jgi:hypothetical protein